MFRLSGGSCRISYSYDCEDTWIRTDEHDFQAQVVMELTTWKDGRGQELAYRIQGASPFRPLERREALKAPFLEHPSKQVLRDCRIPRTLSEGQAVLPYVGHRRYQQSSRFSYRESSLTCKPFSSLALSYAVNSSRTYCTCSVDSMKPRIGCALASSIHFARIASSLYFVHQEDLLLRKAVIS